MSVNRDYKRWFEKDPPLFAQQQEILEAAGFALVRETFDEGAIQFVGHSKSDPGRKLIVVFPETFPSSAPKVYDSHPSKLLIRHHRIDSRQLCLFGFDESRWCATLSVKDALVEAEQLIAEFKDVGVSVEHQPPEPLTRSVFHIPETAMLVPPPISTYEGFGQLKHKSGKFRGKFVHEGDQKKETKGRGIVFEADFGAETIKCFSQFSGLLRNHGKDIAGEWFYLEEPPTQENLPEVVKKCFQKVQGSKKADFYWIALVFQEEVGAQNRTRLTWMVIRTNSTGHPHLVRTFPYIQQERYVRIPDLDGLEQKRAVLIGCGSLGSKIAANLAASGVNRFGLVDFDYFEPNNSVRHELGIEYFGMNKEKALLERLCSLNPVVAEHSSTLTFQVGGIGSVALEQQFYDLLKDADIMIDCSGVHSARHFLNEISFERGIPLVVASVTNGAWAGEIIRMVPGKTPCYLCWLDQYYNHKPPSAPLAKGEVFAPGCDQPTFTGTTYDLGIVAGLATSMCVETLLSGGEKTDLSKNYIRWSGRDKDGNQIFLTEALSTDFQKECWCAVA